MMNELTELFDELNTMFNTNVKRNMLADMIETKDEYKILVDVCGIAKENINISYEDKYLTISVNDATKEENKDKYLVHERTTNYAPKKIYIKNDVDFAGAKAKVVDGVLSITLKKIMPKSASIIIE